MLFRVFSCLLLMGASVTATAEIGTIDQVPASTVLIPHFEVDPVNANGLNTVVTLQNTSASATMVNVVLWTDFGLPTANFNVYLTGFVQETLDLREIFRRVLPRTGSDGQDPQDTISPQGPISQDINFASCNNFLPDVQDGSIIGADLLAAHRGLASDNYFSGLCGARNHGDNIARGYITMDVTNQCTADTPADAGYFVNFGSGVAGNRNILMADYLITDLANGRFFGDSGVHIETDAADPRTNGAGDYTFYARLLGNSGADNREPLPTAWAGRAAAGRTDVEYWRDPFAVVAPFTCGTTPAPFPLAQRQVSLFDANGTLASSPATALFPNASGTTTGATIGIAQPLGWMFVNLNTAPGTIRQSWMSFRQNPSGLAASATTGYMVPGIQLGNASAAADPTVP